MGTRNRFLNLAVASFLSVVVAAGPVQAVDEGRLADLHDRLLSADQEEARRLGKEIALARANSGSAAMNLLLKRGTDALEAGDYSSAIGHFTALTDHAPGFAEGWHMRAVAYAAAEMYGPAVADLERTIALRPNHYDAIATLGGVFIQINRPQQAKQAFDQVLSIHPHHPDVTEALKQLGPEVDGTQL